jgi:uncharacterized repeat protein (TIGR01451 family)
MPKSVHGRRRQGRRQFRRLFLEQFEDRRVLSAIITVNSTDDSDVRDNVLTLREAIEVSNNDGTLAVNSLSSAERQQVNGLPDGVKPNTIAFSIQSSVPGTVQTISPTSALPAIAAPVLIDGYTQPGTSRNTNAIDDPDPALRGFIGVLLIQIDGANAGDANGLLINADGCTVQGLVITHFSASTASLGGDAIKIQNASGNKIVGNLLGTDPTGTVAQGNRSGVLMIGVASTHNIIGGTTPDSRNVISGNTDDGIVADFDSGDTIQGNLIGTDATGTVALGNGDGVFIGGSGAVVGGTASAARNIISGNGRGMFLSDGDSVVVQGNFIGTDISGTTALSNDVGISLTSSFSNTIGGTSSGAGNIIAFNASFGIGVGDDIGNSILGNSIFSNGAIGIDLNDDGATPNDTGDADTGANKLQNFPVLSSAILTTSGFLAVTYRVPSDTANSAYPLRIEFFKADSTGQGQTFLGFDNYDSASANALKTITLQPAVAVGPGDKFVATATDSASTGGNTSEFSATAALDRAPDLEPVNSNNQITVNEATVPLAAAPANDFTLDASDIDSAQTLTFSLVVDNSGVVPGAIAYDPANPAITSLLQITIPSQTPTPGSPPSNSSTATGILEIKAGPNAAMGNPSQTYVFDIQVSDGAGGVATEQVVLTVVQTNSPPQITSDGGGDTAAVSVPENTTAVTQVVATDPDANTTLSYSISGGADATKFSIDQQSGALKFITAPDFEQPTDVGGDNDYEVIVQASDGSLTDLQTITVSVIDVNEPPVITSDGGGPTASVSVPENTTSVTTVTATDPDLSTIPSYSISGGADAAKFTIDPSSGALSFVTPPNFEQPTDNGGNSVYDVIVQASDGSLTDTQAIAVTVTDVNEPPVITSNGGLDQANISIPENTTAVTDVDATDPDAGTTLIYLINGGTDAALFSINASTGVLRFVTPPDFENPTDANADNVYQVIVQASDGSLVTGQQLLVSVTDVNEPPVITSNGGGPTASVSVAENTTSVTTVVASDPDLSTIPSYSISGGADAAKFTIDPSSGALSFVVPPNFEQPTDNGGNNIYDVIVQASDGSLTDSQAIAVTVTDAVEPADLQITNTDGGTTATPGTSLTYTVVVSNAGPNPVKGAVVHDDFPAGFTVSSVTSTGNGGASGFSNTVANNQLNQTLNLPVGSSVTYLVSGTISASATGLLTNSASVTAPTNIDDTNPSNNSATDTDQLSASADLQVTQSAVPNPVKAGNDLTYTIVVNSSGPSDAQSVSLTGNVPANTTFVSLTAPPGWTNAVPAPGGTGGFKSSITTLSAGKGPQVFTLVVNVNATAPGGSTISNTVGVSSTTSDPNSANDNATQTTPVTAQTGTGGVVNDHYVTLEDQPLPVPPPGVLGNDSSTPPGQPLFATLVSGPAHGKVQMKPDGSFVYTPAPDYFGPDTFLYGASSTVKSRGIFAATWNFNAKSREWGQLYSIAPDSTVATFVGKLVPPPGVSELSQPMGLAFTPQGNLYLLTGSYLMAVNQQTAALSVIGRRSSIGVNEGDLVYNPTDGQLYASGAAKDSLVRIDPATGVRTVVGPMGASGRDTSALAFSSDGTLYGVALRDAQPDLLVKIDTQTGHATAIGPTGTNATTKVLAGMAYDPATGTLLFTLSSTLYSIDRLTGAATPIGPIVSASNGQPIGYISGLALEGPALSFGTVGIDVLPVNDAPRFNAGGNQVVGSDFGPQKILNWATAISPGAANESQQHLNFVLNVSPTSLFSVQPAVDAAGTLTYTPAPGAVGTATITVALHDDGGNANGGSDTSAQQTFTITIVPPPGPTGVFLVGGVLRINGGPLTDAASVTLTHNRLLVSGTIGGIHVSQSFTAAQVQRIEAYLGDGNDSLTIGSTVRTPVFADGGAGNDTIRAGGGPSVLVGGDGNDVLTGGSARDVLIGGAGADTLSGGGNSDLLLAGTTSFDQNKAALLAIQAEWTSSRSLNQRMADLRSGSGPFLSPLGVKLVAGATVFDDADVDTLFGGADLDWFFADLSRDKLKDRVSAEKIG